MLDDLHHCVFSGVLYSTKEQDDKVIYAGLASNAKDEYLIQS